MVHFLRPGGFRGVLRGVSGTFSGTVSGALSGAGSELPWALLGRGQQAFPEPFPGEFPGQFSDRLVGWPFEAALHSSWTVEQIVGAGVSFFGCEGGHHMLRSLGIRV